MAPPPPPARPRGPRARTLYRGGDVYTPADPFATALLVEDGVVSWVGSDDAATGVARASSGAAPAGAPLEVVDLAGALVTPAFVDAHVHTTETGLALAGIDLRAATGPDDVLAAVAAAHREATAGAPAGGVTGAGEGRAVLLLGHGWDDTRWQAPAPTADQLERAAPGAEVYLSRVDVHSALVSPALAARAALAGRDGWRPDGRVERDAHHAARDATRALTPAQRAAAQRRALTAAAAAGIGAVHENAAPHVGSAEDLRSLFAVGAETGVEVLALWGELATDAEHARHLVDALGLDADQRARLLGLAGDLCVDGALGSRTAALHAPYADATAAGLPAGHTGHLYLSAAQIADHVVACTTAGLQAGFHVIGDAATSAVVEGWRAAEERLGLPALAGGRHRLEHLEMLTAEQVGELARWAVTASLQPAFDAAWGGEDGMYAARLGSERAAALNPVAALAAAGVPLALGSDSPVTAFAPWEGVRAAAFATNPAHRVSARAGFTAHTRGGWRAARRDEAGVLRPGSVASFALWEAGDRVVQAPDGRLAAWSTDVRSGTQGLPDLTPGVPAPRCLRTVVAGRTVHDEL